MRCLYCGTETDKKICVCCGELKFFEEFHKDARSSDGYRGECKACRKRELDVTQVNDVDNAKTKNVDVKRVNDENNAKIIKTPEDAIKAVKKADAVNNGDFGDWLKKSKGWKGK